MNDLQLEEWKDIPGYEGCYQLGLDSLSVRSLGRERRAGTISYFQEGRVLKPIKHNSGYSTFWFSKKGILEKVLLHRIVALLFHGECPEGMEVLHNDGNPQNNNPSNLRYGTHKENMIDSVRHGTHYSHSRGKLGGEHFASKKIFQYTLDGIFIKEFPSAREAAEEIGGLLSPIRACASGVSKSSYGYKWSYEDTLKHIVELVKSNP